MNKHHLKKQEVRLKRQLRNRKTLRGTTAKPRLSVHRSNTHIQAQIIDDQTGVTLVGLSTTSKEFKGTDFSKKSMKSAQQIGKRIGEIAKEKGISEVVFDRGRFKYHGILATLANAARESGLKF